jgi:hypothetical protein
MTDRVIVYDAALPQTTDILNTNKFGMISQAFFDRAVLGGATAVHGLLCAPTAPASLQVTVGDGSIYQLDEVDASAYGDLGTDANTILKQGILYSPVSLTITPPSTSGYSQVFLVQAILQDIDGGSEVVNYYNATTPSDPFSGPDNDGDPQYTTRTCVCTIVLKAGGAAPTGSQVTPSPDAGYTGLYEITVSNGQSTITSANIVQLPSAPFFPTLPSIPSAVQDGLWVGFNDTGAANAYVITPIPAISAYAIYQKFRVKIANANSGPSTLNIVDAITGDLLGAKSIILPGGLASAFNAGALAAGMIAEFIYDGSNFELVSSAAGVDIGSSGGGGGGGGGGTTNIYNTYEGAGALIGAYSGLVGSAPGGTKTASWTVNQAVVGTALGGTAYTGDSLTLGFNGAGTGAGGMDTGSTPTSADLSIYLIYNPTTNNWNTLGCLGSTSNGMIYAGSHMPAGYTASCLLWTGKTDSSGDIVKFNQLNHKIELNPDLVTTTVPASVWDTLSLSAVAPANAVRAAGTMVGSFTTDSGGGGAWAWIASTEGSTPGTPISGTPSGVGCKVLQLGPGYATSAGSATLMGSLPFDLQLVTAQELFYYAYAMSSLAIYLDSYEF